MPPSNTREKVIEYDPSTDADPRDRQRIGTVAKELSASLCGRQSYHRLPRGSCERRAEGNRDRPALLHFLHTCSARTDLPFTA